MEKIEQKKLKVGCNFTDYTSEIAIWVVKFVRIFNLKLLSYFLQLKCCNSFGKGCKTTLMLLFHKFYVVNRVVKFFCDALQHNGWKKGWDPTFFKDSAVKKMLLLAFSFKKIIELRATRNVRKKCYMNY